MKLIVFLLFPGHSPKDSMLNSCLFFTIHKVSSKIEPCFRVSTCPVSLRLVHSLAFQLSTASLFFTIRICLQSLWFGCCIDEWYSRAKLSFHQPFWLLTSFLFGDKQSQPKVLRSFISIAKCIYFCWVKLQFVFWIAKNQARLRYPNFFHFLRWK